MLAAAERLRRGSEFAVAVRGGRRAGRGTVVVHLHLASPVTSTVTNAKTATVVSAEPVRTDAEQDAAPARAGFVVSRAVGGAVVRNRVRRRLRHLVAERLGALPPGSTLVVRALPGSATASYDRLGVDLDAAMSAARAPRRPGRRTQ